MPTPGRSPFRRTTALNLYPNDGPLRTMTLPLSAPEPDAGPLEGVFLDDNLRVLRKLPDACVDLVYIDPPFGTQQVRTLGSIRTGAGAKARKGFAGRLYQFEVVSNYCYRDDMALPEYLSFLYERLAEIHRVLTPTGSVYLHLDFHAAHYARLLLDELFGPERFLNEVIWAYDYGGRARDRWPKKHDNILWYSKSAKWTFNIDDIDRVPYMAPGLVGPDKAARGKLPTDTWWLTIVPTNGRERTGYPTQKPLKLLERVVRASSNPGELVADFFCGSGTTGVAAKKLGRRYLLVDDNPDAIRITNERLAP
jgi:site-specific DNA-methyltransferase (adenine-specific)